MSCLALVLLEVLNQNAATGREHVPHLRPDVNSRAFGLYQLLSERQVSLTTLVICGSIGLGQVAD